MQIISLYPRDSVLVGQLWNPKAVFLYDLHVMIMKGFLEPVFSEH